MSMSKEQSTRMALRKLTAEASGGNGNENKESEMVSIIIDDSTGRLTISSKQKLQRLNDEVVGEKKGQSQNSKPLIQKVPPILRNNTYFVKHYQPRFISIGPLHHSKHDGLAEELKQGEEVKIKLAAHFIKDNKVSISDLIDKIMLQICNLRRCYREDPFPVNDEYDADAELALMLCVDGCALLQYINYAAQENLNVMNIKEDEEAFIVQDLFLLENQLPYQVLEILMDSCNDSSQQLKNSINKFIERTIASIRFSDKAEAPTPAAAPGEAAEQPTHLLELLWKRLVGPNKQDTTSPQEHQQEPCQSFRNVKELKAAGIKLKSKKIGFLRDISFSTGCFRAALTLPSIAVDDSTAPKFLNLIAYEMCPDFDNNFEVSSYISFLDSLIDEADDVRELRREEILHNLLGSDKEVAKLFNKIGTDLVPNPSTYAQVRRKIQKHYKTQWKTWIAQCLHDHFSTPWTILAFVGAITALLLGAIQTWYTINPPK